MNKTKVKMKKPVYFDLWILGISEIVMYEYWHGYAKPVMELDGYGKHTSNYEVERPLPIGNKKVTG